MPFAFFQMNYQKSIGPRILELCIAGIIFTALVFIGLHAFHFKVVPHDKDDPKGIKRDGSKIPSEPVSRAGEPIITTPLPSQDELIRQLISANRKPQKNQPPRSLAPWEKQMRDIDKQSSSAEDKTRRLLLLANTLTGDDQARVYASASSSAPTALFQQQLYPMIWNPNTPASVTRVLAAGVVTQPDSFKFPALLSLLKHSDEDIRALAESVLWAYFPDEPTNNYPQAVQRFLSGNY
jgi:hypothetical protein